MNAARRYAVISPVRDEEEFLQRTIDSVAGQTEPPARWVIVDDGSTDATPEILVRAAQQHDWISVLTRPPRTARVVGSGVIHAFDDGLATLDLDDYDYLGKLDGDLELPSRYFATLMDLMEADPRLGTASGRTYVDGPDGTIVLDRGAEEMTVGLAKFYRVTAFRDIGGLVPEIMWDGIDCHEMRRHGWRARSFTGPDLEVYTMRPEGVSDRGVLRGRRRHGYGQWFMGTDPAFMLASVLLRARDEPVVIGSAHMLAGYVGSALRRVPQYGPPSFRTQLRRFQREALVLGKQRATARWERRTAHAWPGIPRSATTAFLVDEAAQLAGPDAARELSALRQGGWQVVPMALRGGSSDPSDGSHPEDVVVLESLTPGRRVRHLADQLQEPFRMTATLGRRARSGGSAGLVVTDLTTGALLLGELRSRGLRHVHVHGPSAGQAAAAARLAALHSAAATDSHIVTWSLAAPGSTSVDRLGQGPGAPVVVVDADDPAKIASIGSLLREVVLRTDSRLSPLDARR